ncbi:hypothetical protein NG895_10975 [Aeoliella sp. ICT_H6.2]|uniref:Uncharacterized protein n=1 Tax=Aeoliella straminimaris TaxID=2954799 RepID=A0A9X2JHA4_9BACT|nr:hypothetical protein [Aeoliella straminimaris]MCO6044428.1 hypothetical protein [Aeoliella straminimaris]
MSPADLYEWLTVMFRVPFAALAMAFLVATCLYVYVDARPRTGSRLCAVCLAVAVAVAYWPLSFFAYIACIASVDRRRSRAAV